MFSGRPSSIRPTRSWLCTTIPRAIRFSPSQADHGLTRRLREAAELLQIKLLDHVIIGAPTEGRLPYFSFKEAGVL
jgi:DNA repair protein RadC